MRVFHSHAKRSFAPAALILLLSTTVLCGCSTVGVTSIDQGRTPYNEVIQDTSRQQALLNIVRVSKGESPQFLDVTEVDQAYSVVGSVTGGASSIGATANPKTTSGTFSGVLGALSGTTSYQEAPTVRYIPLLGQALIAQVSTPLTPESIANLTSSDWSFAALLTLSLDRLTPGYADYDAALNALIDLDAYGAIIVAATQSQDADKTVKFTGLTISSTPPATKDSLTIYYQRDHVAVTAAACDTDDRTATESNLTTQARRITDALWAKLQSIYKQKGPVISLKSKGSTGLRSGVPQPPLLTTRSALGILKAGSEQEGSPTLAIMTPEDVKATIEQHRQRNELGQCTDNFYTLDPLKYQTPFQSGSVVTPANAERIMKVSERIANPRRGLNAMTPDAGVVDAEVEQLERILGNSRRFMLISESSQPVSNAFVSVQHRGRWYSIDEKDDISIRTLALISQFNTIQAIPSQSPSLTPTISVGARQ